MAQGYDPFVSKNKRRLVQSKTCSHLCNMKFEDITGNGKLWAVHYDGDADNILTLTFRDWNDIDWLEEFFEKNIGDLSSYFHITDIGKAIYDTIYDANTLQCLVLDISPDANLDQLFRPLNNSRTAELTLGKEKAKGKYNSGHSSWLRLYALKLEPQSYLITGGAIKLTQTMQERQHTEIELIKMEKVRNFLIQQGAVDIEGLKDLKEDESN